MHKFCSYILWHLPLQVPGVVGLGKNPVLHVVHCVALVHMAQLVPQAIKAKKKPLEVYLTKV